MLRRWAGEAVNKKSLVWGSRGRGTKCVCKKLQQTHDPPNQCWCLKHSLFSSGQQTAVKHTSKICAYLALQQETQIWMEKFSF